jgi:hypothetical protein
MKGKKKAKSHTQAQNKSRCKTRFFMVPSYLFGMAFVGAEYGPDTNQ